MFALLPLVLAGCATAPRSVCEPIRVPVTVERERVTVEPVPPALLRMHPEWTGPLRRCPEIAQSNLTELRACNADKRLIRERGHGEAGGR